MYIYFDENQLFAPNPEGCIDVLPPLGHGAEEENQLSSICIKAENCQ